MYRQVRQYDVHDGYWGEGCIDVTCRDCGIPNSGFSSARYSSGVCRSEFAVNVERSKSTFDLGEFCQATNCCNGPVCFDCAFRPKIFCRFCFKWTRVEFLAKIQSTEWFSEKTECRDIGDWFELLEQFDQIEQQLNRHCQLFFLWLKTQKGYIRNGIFHHEPESWDALATATLTRRTQDIICDFQKFLIASKMVVSQTFFTRVHPMDHHFPVRINSKRKQMIPYLLLACHSFPLLSSFTRREILTEFQAGLVGEIAVRLSQSRQDAAFKIFSRMILKLIRKKK